MGGLYFAALCEHVSNNAVAPDNRGEVMEQRVTTHNT